MLYEPP